MKKGIVIEVNQKDVTMLTPDGQFIKARKQEMNYEVGKEIFFEPLPEKNHVVKHIFFHRWKTTLTSTVAVALLFLAFIPYFISNQVYAYMTIDINPSFELALNNDLNVVDIDPLNEEGERIIEELEDWQRKSVEYVTEEIIRLSGEKGFFNEEEREVFIATVTKEQVVDKTTNLNSEIKEIEQKLLKEKIKVTSVQANIETRKQAVEQGISTGKMIQIKEEQKQEQELQREKEQKSEADREQEKEAREKEKEAKEKEREQEKEAREKEKEVREKEREQEKEAREKEKEAREKEREQEKEAREKAKEAREKEREQEKEAREKAKEAREKEREQEKEAREKAKEAREKEREREKEAREKAKENKKHDRDNED